MKLGLKDLGSRKDNGMMELPKKKVDGKDEKLHIFIIHDRICIRLIKITNFLLHARGEENYNL